MVERHLTSKEKLEIFVIPELNEAGFSCNIQHLDDDSFTVVAQRERGSLPSNICIIQISPNGEITRMSNLEHN